MYTKLMYKKSELNPLGHFMTNIDTIRKEAIEKAAKESGMDVWTEDNASDLEGYPLYNSIAVFTTEECNLTEFWDLYHKFLGE